MPNLTSSRVDRAGRVLRRFARGDLSDETEVSEARAVAREFRAAHSYPLAKVTVGLRQFIDSERGDLLPAPPAQRLSESMRLSQMQDVAGCRAVLHPLLIPRIARRIRRNWDIVAEDDYFTRPKEDGYRALHIIVRRDTRLVEIQLRTTALHVWAEILERASAATATDLKHGQGPRGVREAFAQLAGLLHGLESGAIAVDDATAQRIATLTEPINRFMRGEHIQ
jgi:putative GTP pyrophosphokinase